MSVCLLCPSPHPWTDEVALALPLQREGSDSVAHGCMECSTREALGLAPMQVLVEIQCRGLPRSIP